jgi:hypothetical protein
MEDVMYDPRTEEAIAKLGVATGLDQGGRYGNL